MNTIQIVLLVIGGCSAGSLFTFVLIRSHWRTKFGILQVQYESSQKKLEEQSAYMSQSGNAMREMFGSLAADALQRNNQTFVTLAETKLNEKVTEARGILEGKEKAIDGLVQPLAKSLENMDKKINELETKREGAYSSMKTVLEGMQQSAQSLDRGTQNLVSALKSSGTRGRYGEIGLRRVVEFAGMIEHCDFTEQVSVSGDEGALRPDMIIHLPENKSIVVDSKIPLDAYLKVFDTDFEVEKNAYLVQHARAVRDHMNRLGAKSYWRQFPESPDYVVMYMQIESSFGAALQSDPDLIEDGIRNHVILATPTTLITLLRTVGFVWQQRSVAENIDAIREAGIDLYNRTTVLLKHFSNIGGSLGSAVDFYNKAVASLESRFIPQARKLYALGSAYTDKTIPDVKQVETAARQFDAPPPEEREEDRPEGMV